MSQTPPLHHASSEDLQIRNAALQALIDATPGVSLLINREGIILSANVKAVTHFGIAHSQLIGTNVYSLFDEKTSAGRRAIANEAAQLRHPVYLEDERAGIYFRHSLVPVVNGDAPVEQIAVFAEDITVRRLAEIALRTSEEKYRFLAENTSDVIWQLDGQMRFLYANDSYHTLSGFTREEVLGRSVMELFTPQGRGIVMDMMAKRREAEANGDKKASLRFEVPHLRKHGEPFWAEINSTPIYDKAGQIIAFNGIMRDIDDRKRDEVQLETAHAQLKTQLQEITELQTQLQEQAVRDPLTGLHNRRYLEETLPRELSRAQREGYPLALIMVDLDHFKRVNDTYGHPAGDTVLKTTAEILNHSARTGDIICRLGGEEFLVALPMMNVSQACARAQEWRKILEETTISHGEFQIRLTLSGGVSGFPAHGADVSTLLGQADEALYRAKRDGRNRIEVSTLPA